MPAHFHIIKRSRDRNIGESSNHHLLNIDQESDPSARNVRLEYTMRRTYHLFFWIEYRLSPDLHGLWFETKAEDSIP